MDAKFPHLPAWKCHKVVHAGKIDLIEPTNENTRLGLVWDMPTTEYDNSPGRLFILVPPEWVAKHKPQVGGYFVVYGDDYQSFSPSEAFEDGYMLLE